MEPLLDPAADVTFADVGISFSTLAGYSFAFGLAFCVEAFLRGMFGTVNSVVGWIPYANKVIEQPLIAIEHKVLSFVGGLEAHLEIRMAKAWHGFANLTSLLARDTVAAAVYDYQLAKRIAAHWENVVVKTVVGTAHNAATRAIHTTQTVTKTIVRVERIAVAGASRATVGSVKAVAGELEHVIDYTIPGLRARTKAIEAELGRVFHRIRAIDRPLGITALTAAVAVALGRLGGGWIRCGNWNRIGKTVCNSPLGEIEDILGLLTAAAIATNLREIVKLGQEVEHGVVSAVHDLVGV